MGVIFIPNGVSNFNFGLLTVSKQSRGEKRLVTHRDNTHLCQFDRPITSATAEELQNTDKLEYIAIYNNKASVFADSLLKVRIYIYCLLYTSPSPRD